jgi:hypothetical protein
MRQAPPFGSRVSALRPFLALPILAMVFTLAMSGTAPAQSAAQSAAQPAAQSVAQSAAPAPPWWDATFAANERACTSAAPPPWCVRWVEALNADLRPFGDRTAPEWRALPYARNREICGTLLPPAWCADWRAYIRTVPETEAYKAVAARYEAATKAENAAIAAARAEQDAREGPLRAVLDKVTAGRTISRDDWAVLEGRIAEDGNPQATEVLAWLHVQGRGVPRDYGRAYELYGDLVMKGRDDLKKNLDALWPLLTGAQKLTMQERFGPPSEP